MTSAKRQLQRMGTLAGTLALSAALLLAGCGGTDTDAPADTAAQDEQVASTQDGAGEQGTDEQDDTLETSSADDPTNGRLDLLVLVNKTHALPDGWEDNLQLVEHTNGKGYTVAVDQVTYDAFMGLVDELAEQGITIDLNSGYRSIAEQEAIVEEFTADYGEDYVREFVAEPGHSEHHTGLALDAYLIEDGVPILTNDEIFARQDTWDQIHALLPKYGFILRYPQDGEDITGYTYEPWHYRYVGVGPATEMYESGQTLEEYLGEA